MNNQEEMSEIESDGLLGQSTTTLRKKYGSRRLTHILVVISISLNIFLVGLGLIYWICNKQTVQRSYEHGYASDLGSVKSEIELVQYRFAGGVELDENGHFFTNHTSTSSQYVGTPTREIDHAWGRLLTGLNIDLDESDWNNLDGKTFQWPDSGLYFTGLEVFHSLHCLNRLRQAFYPDYYDIFNNPKDPSREAHIGHCINHIRQVIQCHADLTPMEWTRVGNKVILKTDTLHTCRNFEKIHDWARERRTRFDEIESVRNGSLFIVD